jgi:hypothetical protein
MMETERRYRELAAESEAKKPRGSAQKKALETNAA